jgi:hypothetical protein
MIDTTEVLRTFLLAQPGLTAGASTRFYGERETPAPEYVPDQGWAFCFKRRGGGQDYESVVLDPSYQFKCYGPTEVEANRAYQALFDALNGAGIYLLKAAEMEAQGQTLYEPKTGWPYVLVFYKLMFLN